ncbi:MAG TPA: PAS domain-containing protein, partial [Desulfobulbaceae bacterium]|nr:PAS domain-containing protein [Desulfobulbaceae bacterium]
MSTKFRVVLGLSGIIISFILLATYFGIVPDRVAEVRAGRADLAESIAVHSTAMVIKKDFKQLVHDFTIIVERNSDLLSIGLAGNNGSLMAATPGHKDHWQGMDGKYSKESQVRVPIWNGRTKWGELELRFVPLRQPGILGLVQSPMVRMILFVGVGSFVVFYFYLGKVLSILDPAKAVPARVRTALDTMAEGLLVLDHKEQIVLANQAFAEIVGKTSNELLGYKAGVLPWQDMNGSVIQKEQRPWVQAITRGKVQKNRMIRLVLADGQRLSFNVNCSPVLGKGKKYAGVLVSFDDIT